MQPLVYTPEQAAKVLCVGRNVMYELIHSGAIRSFRTGPNGRRILISHQACLDFIAQQEALNFDPTQADTSTADRRTRA